MLFYSYKNKFEFPRLYPFVELQYCKMRRGKKLKKLVSIRSIKSNQEDSLYISSDDMYEFFDCYSGIIKNGVYNNMRSGYIDLYGINYYSPDQTQDIISRLEQEKPKDYSDLLEWLKRGISYNGFYILGV